MTSTHKKKIDSGKHQFIVVLTAEQNGWYSATCPELPGCHSQGKGVEKTLANMRESIQLVMEDMESQGVPIPQGEAIVATVQL